MKKHMTLLLTFLLGVTSMPFAPVQAAQQLDHSANSALPSGTKGGTHSQPLPLDPKDFITVSSVAEQFGVDGHGVHLK